MRLFNCVVFLKKLFQFKENLSGKKIISDLLSYPLFLEKAPLIFLKCCKIKIIPLKLMKMSLIARFIAGEVSL